jgi:hypothetical protein
VQADALHTAVAFARLHLFPHVLQLFTSFVVFTSQPSEAVLLQSANPVLHEATAQADEVHVAVALARLHTWPQVPQLLTSLVVLAQ